MMQKMEYLRGHFRCENGQDPGLAGPGMEFFTKKGLEFLEETTRFDYLRLLGKRPAVDIEEAAGFFFATGELLQAQKELKEMQDELRQESDGKIMEDPMPYTAITPLEIPNPNM